VAIKQIFLTNFNILAAILGRPIINYIKQGHTCVRYNYSTRKTRTHNVKNEHGIPLRFNENVNARHEHV